MSAPGSRLTSSPRAHTHTRARAHTHACTQAHTHQLHLSHPKARHRPHYSRDASHLYRSLTALKGPRAEECQTQMCEIRGHINDGLSVTCAAITVHYLINDSCYTARGTGSPTIWVITAGNRCPATKKQKVDLTPRSAGFLGRPSRRGNSRLNASL